MTIYEDCVDLRMSRLTLNGDKRLPETSHPSWIFISSSLSTSQFEKTLLCNLHLDPRLHFLPIAHCPLHNTWCICSILRHVFSECFLTVLWIFSECALSVIWIKWCDSVTSGCVKIQKVCSGSLVVHIGADKPIFIYKAGSDQGVTFPLHVKSLITDCSGVSQG